MTAGLEVRNLSVAFGGIRALDGIDLVVAPGTVHAVIGPNGAGKSTLFGVIAGDRSPSRGQVLLDGRDVSGWPAHRRVRFGMARAFQVARVFSTLTVLDNMCTALLVAQRRTAEFWRPARTVQLETDARAALRTMELDELAPLAAGELSQGDRKRLEIAMALALSPRILLLDEPTAGMSAAETEATTGLVARLHRDHGVTVLLTEHDMSVVFRLAETLTVLHRGRLLCTGPPAEVRSRPDVAEIYLGAEAL